MMSDAIDALQMFLHVVLIARRAMPPSMTMSFTPLPIRHYSSITFTDSCRHDMLPDATMP